MYTKNYKISFKEIKEYLQKWKDIPYSFAGKLKIVRMEILLQLIYRFNTMPINITAEIGKLFPKLRWKFKTPTIDKTTLKKNKVGELTFPHFRTHYKSTVTKTVW